MLKHDSLEKEAVEQSRRGTRRGRKKKGGGGSSSGQAKQDSYLANTRGCFLHYDTFDLEERQKA